MRIEKTETGTFLLNRIEYNDMPPPGCLVKAMSRGWASKLREDGVLRIHQIDYYRNWENPFLGDPEDGNGLYHLNSHPMNTGSVNDVYAWCTSLPVVTSSRISLIAKHSNYDCIIVVSNPQAMFERIKDYLLINYTGFYVHCGKVKYDKGNEIDKRTLNSQKFHFNVFQKDASFSDDNEYRLSVTNANFTKKENKYIDLILGDCSDLISIERLPNETLNMDYLNH